ncbi:glycosyltransferase family 2 protein [Pelagibacterium lacus]|uniref:Glycosyltransferase family 2 protein n=1 Tax=Pelagibacterium lacus TaxID=2282655 RepID=A0A369W680_9HYPH|nr:glycosyltransferase family A protein [Pelagibacterium lacus]RDE09537.1 glycosyltransferase family 2 protein [Pelagibacterium lacus]
MTIVKRDSSESISVVIPAFNAGKYLKDAIDSIGRQTRRASEIIVVDDGSEDDTAEVARSAPAVRYVRQDNGGVASALNHGVRVASSALIAFLSADDVWDADKLERQAAALGNAPGRLVFGHMRHFLSPELPEAVARTLVCPPDPMPAYSAGTLLTRRDTFGAVGPFDESFAVGEFIDWYGRARDGGMEVVMLDAIVSLRRVHDSNYSARTLRSKSYAPVLKATLDRRRAQEGGA